MQGAVLRCRLEPSLPQPSSSNAATAIHALALPNYSMAAQRGAVKSAKNRVVVCMGSMCGIVRQEP